MGFFALRPKTKPLSRTVSVELLHKSECRACPLNNQDGLIHPYMEATGNDTPTIYMLGEAPGGEEDRKGIQFVGPAGRVLRSRIPDNWADDIRWNNCVRCRPPGNKTPEFAAIECCRPSVQRDIEATKPVAIFGFGNVPLHWALKQTGILKWCGRHVPVKIGSHKCWFFPLMHPSYVNRKRSNKDRDASDIEFAFTLELKRAFAMVEAGLPEPIIHTKEDALEGIEFVTGEGADDKDTVLEFLDSLRHEKAVGFDYETKGLRPYAEGARILTVGLSTGKRTLAFPLDHSGSKWSIDDRAEVEDAFNDFLYDAPCKKIVHQLPFELEWSAFFYGDKVCRASKWEDTVTQAFVLDERMKMGKPDCHSLEFLTVQYFGFNLKDLSKLNRNKLDEEKLEDVLLYNGLDAKYHRALHMKQVARLREEGLYDVYRERLEAVPTMVLTQLQGLPISRKAVDRFYERYRGRLDKVEAEIKESEEAKAFKKKFHSEFRPSANVDVKKLCHKILNVFIDKTDEAELKKIKNDVIKLVLQWRGANKILSTYVLPVKEGSPHLFGDKIHPIVSTTRTRTGRSASEDPNIQNWPKRSDEQKEVRGQIKPRKGPRGARKIVSFDYGQIQARNVAMESKDKALVKAFWDEYDIHMDWAERIAELYPAWVKRGMKTFASDKAYRKALRNEAKNDLVFPWFFGAQPPSISKYLGVPRDIAEQVHEEISAMFPDVAAWQDRLRKFYRTHGYVTGLTGFRRRAPISPNQLINSPIQADEAAIVFDAMNRLSQQGEQAAMEIHDDLSFIWYQSEIEKRAEFVIGEMLACPFEWAQNVPLVVEMAVGDDWYTLKDVGAYSSAHWKGDIKAGEADLKLIGSWSDGTGWADTEYAKGNAFSHPRRRGER